MNDPIVQRLELRELRIARERVQRAEDVLAKMTRRGTRYSVRLKVEQSIEQGREEVRRLRERVAGIASEESGPHWSSPVERATVWR